MKHNRRQEIERHPNGTLAYHCTWLELDPLQLYKYPDHRGPDKEGKYWTRVGWHRKYFDNKQLAWQLKYNTFGILIPHIFISFRKDGSVITF